MRGPEHGGNGVCTSRDRVRRPERDRTSSRFRARSSMTKGEEDGTIGFAKDLREILQGSAAILGEVAIGLSRDQKPLSQIVNQAMLLENDIAGLAGESIAPSRTSDSTRSAGRSAGSPRWWGGSPRWSKPRARDDQRVGPARMVDLRSDDQRHEPDPRPAGSASWSRTTTCISRTPGTPRGRRVLCRGRGQWCSGARDSERALRPALSDVVMPQMDGHELYLVCAPIIRILS